MKVLCNILYCIARFEQYMEQYTFDRLNTLLHHTNNGFMKLIFTNPNHKCFPVVHSSGHNLLSTNHPLIFTGPSMGVSSPILEPPQSLISPPILFLHNLNRNLLISLPKTH